MVVHGRAATMRGRWLVPPAPHLPSTSYHLPSVLHDLQICVEEIPRLRQYRVLKRRRIPHPDILRRHALDRRVEPGETLFGDARRDLGAVPPRERGLVRHYHPP